MPMPFYPREHPVDVCLDEQAEMAEEALARPSEAAHKGELNAEIQRRVQAARRGEISPDLRELLADIDRTRELGAEMEPMDEDEDEDPAEVEAAWAEEIDRRVEEIRSGTVKTYALEDVLAAMELRYG